MGFARGGKQILIEVATVTIMEDFGVGGGVTLSANVFIRGKLSKN